MRLFFIPGFGEDETIFEKIHPHLPGNKIILNNWNLIGDEPRQGFTALQYARQLVEAFNISREDVVIGHSMGGWIAYHIKHLVHCPVVQIASWTDGHKVVSPVKDKELLYWSVKKGIYFNRLIKYLLIWKSYRHKPSRSIFSATFDRLRKGNKNNVINQLQIIFNEVKEPIKEKPDLRIHARADNIIRYPREESCCEVPGDHFTLYTHPEEVYIPIAKFLQQRQEKAD